MESINVQNLIQSIYANNQITKYVLKCFYGENSCNDQLYIGVSKHPIMQNAR